MMADGSLPASASCGSLAPGAQQPFESLYSILDFLREQLPCWRDRDDRKKVVSEPRLTSQLCAHLNGAARRSKGWDNLQFRIEEPDEVINSRKLDLVAAPCGTPIWVEGRRHVDFDTLLPIECKRLPTPKEKDRDEREYVFSQYKSTGGIQRFKAGNHGSTHTLGAMIAYVQEGSRSHWKTQVAGWINGLADTGKPGWTAKDLLHAEHDDETVKVSVLRSFHTRIKGLQDIELQHLWISMN
jgi:hypothetical protein